LITFNQCTYDSRHKVSDSRRLLSTLHQVSPLHLLGLSDSDENASRLKALQRVSLRYQTRISLPIGLCMAMLSAYLMLAYVPPIVPAVWLGITALVCSWAAYAVHFRRATRRLTQDSPAPIYALAVAGALMWAAPFWFAGLQPNIDHILTNWAIALFVMLSFTLLAHSLPLACILFILPITFSATLALAVGPLVQLAIIPLLTGLMLCAFCVRLADNHVRMRLADEKLREKRNTITLLLRASESTADWLWQTDADGCLEQVSSRFATALLSRPNKLEGMHFFDLIAPDFNKNTPQPHGLLELRRKFDEKASFASLTIALNVGGEKRWWQVSAAPRRNDRDEFIGYQGVGSDVTDQYVSAKQIARLARIDTVTNLPNRLSLQEELADALAEAQANNSRCAMLIIDLDRFKIINDTMGHGMGDQLLGLVADRLRGLMEQGCTCGRLVGDEFAIIIRRPDSHASIEAFARHIIATLSRPYQLGGQLVFVGASAGYAMGPHDGETVETLSHHADLALYKSKDKGGNGVEAYVPMLLAQAEERLWLEQELRTALEKQELQIYYQPVVNAKSEQLIGFEALLRWHSAKLGAVGPARFIPIAEESRLINPIGEWVLRTACREAMSWPAHLKVAVNVSPEQLTNPQFASIVLSALAQSGLPPHRLEIEVTENLFMRDGGGAVKILDQLLAIGVRLSLDDFGTGYSSFGYLRKARFSTVKVDRSFVSSAAKGSVESIAIIRAVVALANGLGMATIAEGVETEEELATVRSLGCRNIQGFYFGRPMTPASIRQYFPALPSTHSGHERKAL
jgi:diguanylate cyclase (GGDEF)-like protein/PAS domain S-box-containing protein